MKFATLGPAGTNHDLNTRRYIEFHAVAGAEVVYLKSFFDGLDQMLRGEVDFMIQVCAHHHVAEVIERNYKEDLPGRLLHRQDQGDGRVDADRGGAASHGRLHLADRRLLHAVGLAGADSHPVECRPALRLLSGELDSGFTSLELASDHPGRFRIDKEIGEVDVAWLVYGKTRVNAGPLIAWRDAPVRSLLSPPR